jgi:hypothetical protein
MKDEHPEDYEIRLIESKLRNSFVELKKDIDRIKEFVFELNLSLKKISFDELKKTEKYRLDEMEEIKEEISLIRKSEELFEEKLIQLRKKRIPIELKKNFFREFKAVLTKEIEKLTRKQKRTLNELEKKNKKKVVREIDKIKNTNEDLKKEFLMFRNEFIKIREENDLWKKEIGKELKEILDKEKREQKKNFYNLKEQIRSNTLKNKKDLSNIVD